ncbi:MAG: undecaprenyl-diphosphatase [Candidatus Wallbacteria bacterium HGW-Wallbacteria-1]|jgi:undecaprenyl-diphosphatase|uniref:Undecaprenyl-diphosphatase n=1 Tax=Candidatus Wallbacteria bacterium HGW-Wallbacteria-1 TaxID=2013854 RepID=A0A2N1PTR9_9BACT|nr:MAG: undecaprenyl-diphosphatase [Candidatus Wallbacteria bacterium HGW-Wallbacteria-1]
MEEFGMIKFASLGILQGLTEFLPVSSSGHLVIAKGFMKIPEDMAFDVLLHFASAMAIGVYFRKDLWKIVRQMGTGLKSLAKGDGVRKAWDGGLMIPGLVVLASVPAGIVGVGFKSRIEALFGAPKIVAAALLLTGTVLFLSRRFSNGTEEMEKLTVKKAMLIGIAQAMAIMPGISRAGSTIVAGMALGMKREEAARFSFLLALPAICGAILLDLGDILKLSGSRVADYSVGFIASFLFSLAALATLFRILGSDHFSSFAYYCWALGLAILIV